MKVDGKSVILKIIEEALANGNFRMKSNFNPYFASNFEMEDEESWSLGCSDEMAMKDESFKAMQNNILLGANSHKKGGDKVTKDKAGDECL
ncbi:hypothetical protein SLA2020_153430 [Shorea laevis]